MQAYTQGAAVGQIFRYAPNLPQSGTLCFRRLRLAVSGGGSNPPVLVLFLVVCLMLVVFSYMKNRMLTTLDSGHSSEKGDSNMGKVTTFVKCSVASVIDVSQALGTSLVAFGGPLT